MVEEVVGSGMRKSEVNRNEKINIYSGERLLSAPEHVGLTDFATASVGQKKSPRERGDAKTTHTNM